MAEAKGDSSGGKDWLFEHKSTVHNSMKLEYDWLGKISQEAMVEGRWPALTVSFTSVHGRAVNFGDWVLVPKHVFDELRGEEGDGVLAERKG